MSQNDFDISVDDDIIYGALPAGVGACVMFLLLTWVVLNTSADAAASTLGLHLVYCVVAGALGATAEGSVSSLDIACAGAAIVGLMMVFGAQMPLWLRAARGEQGATHLSPMSAGARTKLLGNRSQGDVRRYMSV